MKVDFKMAQVWQFLSGYTSLTVKERRRARSASHLFKEFRQSTFCAVVLLSHQKTDARAWGIKKPWPGKRCKGRKRKQQWDQKLELLYFSTLAHTDCSWQHSINVPLLSVAGFETHQELSHLALAEVNVQVTLWVQMPGSYAVEVQNLHLTQFICQYVPEDKMSSLLLVCYMPALCNSL